MGLDSVELLVDLEHKFGLVIPDLEAENIYTVDHLVGAFYSKLGIQNTDHHLKQSVFYSIRKALVKRGYKRSDIRPTTELWRLFDKQKIQQEWLALEQDLQLDMPKLVKLDYTENLGTDIRLFGMKIYQRPKAITASNIKQLIDWIVSLNYEQFIKLDKLNNRYELERIVVAEISRRLGIPIAEIELHHSITKDLGID